MKSVNPRFFSLLALFMATPGLAGQNSIETIQAAERLDAEAQHVMLLVHGSPALKNAEWDSERLAQATERFPNLLGVGQAFFNIERKFRRISELTRSVEDKLLDSSHCHHSEVKESVAALESAYSDLEYLLYEESVEPGIDPVVD